MAKKQSTQNISITGKVVENNIKIGPSKTTGKVYATGNLVIQTEEGNQVEVGVLQGQLKKDGDANKLFKTISAFEVKCDLEGAPILPVTGLKSIAAFGEEEADVIEVTAGEFVDSSFYADDGNLITHTRIRAPFFNKLSGPKAENFKPTSKFDVEVVINSVTEEMDKEENFTGRLVVNAYTIAFNGEAVPIKFIAGHVDEDATPEEKQRAQKAVQYIMNNHEKGMTVKYSGSIVSNTETRVVEEEVEFGEPIINEFTSTKSENRILSGTMPYEEERAFTAEKVAEGVRIRETSLEEARARKQATPAAGSGGAGIDDAFGSSLDNSFGGDQLPQF